MEMNAAQTNSLFSIRVTSSTESHKVRDVVDHDDFLAIAITICHCGQRKSGWKGSLQNSDVFGPTALRRPTSQPDFEKELIHR